MWSRTPAPVDDIGSPEVEPYIYRSVLEVMGEDGAPDSGDEDPIVQVSNPARQAGPDSCPARKNGISEDEVRAREEQARALGFREGEAQAGVKFERELSAEREALAKALGDFGRERESYFCRVEAEVVKLAIGIARKILHREVQVDPLLLAGVVRVALEKIAAGTSVRLRVHPDHVYAWHDFFANQPEHGPTPELLGDATLGMGHCVLETALGTAELTLEAQLGEIERGFFDLLAQRPVTS